MRTSSLNTTVCSSTKNDITPVPDSLIKGTKMLKLSPAKRHERTFWLDPAQNRLLWDSKKRSKSAVVNMEWIKEIRVGPEAKIFRKQFNLSSRDQDRWFSVVYVEGGKYKNLNLVSPTRELL
ncbi:hypothetical protein K7432_006697, partial [Basidiobolus ranarum]